MNRAYLITLLSGVAYLAVVCFIILHVSQRLGESASEQKYFVPMLMGGVVFTLIVYVAQKEKE